MIMRGVLYFVVDDPLRERFREMGGQPFSYQTKKGQKAIQRYYSVPAELLEAPEQLCAAANSAFAHALASSKGSQRAGKRP
jgi:DNA transformation protein